MYALALLRYRRPLEEILPQVEAHRSYLRGLQEEGLLLASGPFEPRHGCALLLRVPDADPDATFDRIRAQDPYVTAGLVQYEMWQWHPVLGREELDRLGAGPPTGRGS